MSYKVRQKADRTEGHKGKEGLIGCPPSVAAPHVTELGPVRSVLPSHWEARLSHAVSARHHPPLTARHSYMNAFSFRTSLSVCLSVCFMQGRSEARPWLDRCRALWPQQPHTQEYGFLRTGDIWVGATPICRYRHRCVAVCVVHLGIPTRRATRRAVQPSTSTRRHSPTRPPRSIASHPEVRWVVRLPASQGSCSVSLCVSAGVFPIWYLSDGTRLDPPVIRESPVVCGPGDNITHTHTYTYRPGTTVRFALAVCVCV